MNMVLQSADLSRRALNTLYLILKTPLYLLPGLKFRHVAKRTVKQVRNSSNSLKLAREGWGGGWGGGPPSGSDQVLRSTKHVSLVFQSSLMMAYLEYLTNAFARQKQCFQKRKTHRHYTHNAFIAFGYQKATSARLK